MIFSLTPFNLFFLLDRQGGLQNSSFADLSEQGFHEDAELVKRKSKRLASLRRFDFLHKFLEFLLILKHQVLQAVLAEVFEITQQRLQHIVVGSVFELPHAFQQ